jgi:hypothetical protein
MKTLIFNGSPRKNGDTAALINQFTKHINGDYRVIEAYDCISSLVLIADTVGKIMDVAKKMICRQSMIIFKTVTTFWLLLLSTFLNLQDNYLLLQVDCKHTFVQGPLEKRYLYQRRKRWDYFSYLPCPLLCTAYRILIFSAVKT